MVCETWLQARLSEGYGFVTDERENITRVSRTDRLNLTITPQILAAGLAIRGRAIFFFFSWTKSKVGGAPYTRVRLIVRNLRYVRLIHVSVKIYMVPTRVN